MYRYELARGEGERFVIDGESGISASVRGDDGRVITVAMSGPISAIFAANLLLDLFTAVDPWVMVREVAENVSAL